MFTDDRFQAGVGRCVISPSKPDKLSVTLDLDLSIDDYSKIHEKLGALAATLESGKAVQEIETLPCNLKIAPAEYAFDDEKLSTSIQGVQFDKRLTIGWFKVDKTHEERLLRVNLSVANSKPNRDLFGSYVGQVCWIWFLKSQIGMEE